MPEISDVKLIVGLEIHVELATRTKMFSRVPSVAHPANFDAPPNSLIDPVTLGLPGALPVMNAEAVELAMMIGLALACAVAPGGRAVWDRKSYFYPDLPKNYQISQYQLPLCEHGSVELPPIVPGGGGRIDYDRLAAADGAAASARRIRIVRAHLEEDAGKLLHEAPGGLPVEGSLADYNRAGTPLLEIVTAPDFGAADEVVVFCRLLRNVCRFLGASEGVLQRGHMRFEPNINCELTLVGGRTVKTPIVEIKNLNSFKAVQGAIEFELADQPRRWQADGLELRPGTKTTRGWDDARGVTFVQREKEEAHDYRYFPDPDLLPVVVDAPWLERVRASVAELPLDRTRRFMREFALTAKEAAALTEERDVCLFFERATDEAASRGVPRARAGRVAANVVLQSAAKRANERSTQDRPVLASELGITPAQVGTLVQLREDGDVGSTAADELFGLLAGGGEPAGADPREVAQRRGLIIVRDAGALDAWCDQVIAANPKAADDVRAGKLQAAGRLVGEVMKLAAGAADAKTVRETLLKKLGQSA